MIGAGTRRICQGACCSFIQLFRHLSLISAWTGVQMDITQLPTEYLRREETHVALTEVAFSMLADSVSFPGDSFPGHVICLT